MGGRVDQPVECYSGGEYAERPAVVIWEEQRCEVMEIEARWRAPDGKFFRVRVKDGLRFELFYNEALDNWQVHLI